MKLYHEVVGRYCITELIGQGGMASVYVAEHEMLGSRVAVKVLNPMLSVNDAIRERFRNEARIMASLNHPNIARVIDFDEQQQQLSIIMELLEGEDLSRRIRDRGPLTDVERKNVFSQVLSALQYAHDKGVVHRDIKPSNIYLSPHGQVKVLDFGIAKVYGQGNDLTHTGQQIGTPVYMSPEQVRSEKTIDHRTDIYSLGVTMFFAVYGKPPYNAERESQFDIFNKIVYEPIPSLIGGGLVEQMVQKACAKDRAHRFQQCLEWLDMLKGTVALPRSGEETLVSVDRTIVESSRKTSSQIQSGTRQSRLQTVFPEVRIGNQVWMSENLNVDQFRNGDVIPQIISDEEWAYAGANQQPVCCYYENKRSHGKTYGRLYNWYAVNDPRGLAPQGWHVPDEMEWERLIVSFGGKIGRAHV